MPLLAVFDRPRTVVAKSGVSREVERFNPTFAQVMLELGVGAEMCGLAAATRRVRSSIVKWVKNTFFKWRRFADGHDLQTQLAAWVREANFETPSRATKEIPETLRQKELPRLRPVRISPETLALRVPIFVGPTAEVMFEGARTRCHHVQPMSQAPPSSSRTAFTSSQVASKQSIRAARRVTHRRPWRSIGRRSSRRSTAPAPALYEKREQLLRIGTSALELLTALTHRAPRRSPEHIERLYELFEEHGEASMREALRDVVKRGDLTVAAVQSGLTSRGGGAR